MATTLGTVQELITQDYLAWYKRGREKGIWLQEGVLYLEGKAGIGKTEILYQIAEALRKEHDIPACKVTELYVSSAMDPESVAGTAAPVTTTITRNKGLPNEYSEQVSVLRMHYKEELVNALAAGDGGIIFIDEAGREPTHMRPLLLKLLSPQKTLAGLDLSRMYVIVAGNPSDEQHLVAEILEDAAMASRLIRVQAENYVDTWADWMYTRKTASHREVANFVLENPSMFIGRDSQDTTSAYHCPRSWTIAASKLHDLGQGTEEKPGSMKNTTVSIALHGIIGPAATQALRVFLDESKAMSLKHILEGRFKPDSDNRIHGISPSVIKSLRYHIENKVLSEDEFENVRNFLKLSNVDTTAFIYRDNQNIHPENMQLFVRSGFFHELIGRIHTPRRVRRNAPDNTPANAK